MIAARYPASRERIAQAPLRSAAAIPLSSRDRALGALGLGFAEAATFAADDLAFHGLVARQSAVALERARLYDAERRARDKAQAAEHLARREASAIATFANVSRAIAEAGFDVPAALDAAAGSSPGKWATTSSSSSSRTTPAWLECGRSPKATESPPPGGRYDRHDIVPASQPTHGFAGSRDLKPGRRGLIVNDVPRERDETLAHPSSWERLQPAHIRSLLVVPLRPPLNAGSAP